MSEKFRLIREVSWLKTMYFNLTYFPLKQAVQLPVFIYRRTDLQEMKGEIVLHCPVRPGILKIGVPECHTPDKKNQRTKWKVAGTVVLNGNVLIGRGCVIRLFTKDAKLTFGSNVTISGRTDLVCKKQISIGNDSLLSWDILVIDTDIHHILDADGQIINVDRPITIGNHVWIGCRCTILKGTEIADNIVVAANSTVTGKIDESHCIVGGQKQTQVLKQNINWEN